MRIVLAATALVLVAGCSSGGSDTDTSQPPAQTDACAEVRAGIDAFNEGDYAGTVDHFREAVPLAQDQADEDDSQKAADLLEAVKYYADLSPEDYPEAARSSEDFAKYKEITLGQCVPIEQPDGGSDEPPAQEA